MRAPFAFSENDPCIFCTRRRQGVPRELVATFDTEAAVARLRRLGDPQEEPGRNVEVRAGERTRGYRRWHGFPDGPLTDEDPLQVVHNPSPSML